MPADLVLPSGGEDKKRRLVIEDKKRRPVIWVLAEKFYDFESVPSLREGLDEQDCAIMAFAEQVVADRLRSRWKTRRPDRSRVCRRSQPG